MDCSSSRNSYVHLQYFQYDLLTAAANGGVLDPETARSNDLRQVVIAVLSAAVQIGSAVVFIQWFRRAYYNLHLKNQYLSYSEEWAAFSWFVPILNFFRPLEIMRELYNETDVILEEKVDGYKKRGVSVVGLWWTLWIINTILAQTVSWLSRNSETAEELRNDTMMSLLLVIVYVPLIFVTMKVIKDYSAMEEELFNLKEEELNSGE